jgi:hypothetical protein
MHATVAELNQAGGIVVYYGESPYQEGYAARRWAAADFFAGL